MRNILACLLTLMTIGARAADYNTSITGLTTQTLTSSAALMVRFVSSANRFVPKITLYAGKTGVPTGNLRATIMSDLDGSPVCASAPPYAIIPSSVPSDPGFISMAYAGSDETPFLTSGTAYWIVVYDLEDPDTDQYVLGANSDTSFATFFSDDSNICIIGDSVDAGLIFAPFDAVGSPTVTISPTFSVSPVYTATSTSTTSPTPSITKTWSLTQTSTLTRTSTQTITSTPTPRSTFTYTPTRSPTMTQTTAAAATATTTPRATRTFTQTLTDTGTITQTFTISPTRTETLTWTSTRTPTYTPFGSSPTNSPTLRSTFTNTPTFTVSPTFSATRTATSTRTSSNTVSPTRTPTVSPTPTVTRTPFTCTYTYVTTYDETDILSNPEGLWNSIDNNGIYVCDFSGIGGISKFDYNGNFISSFTYSTALYFMVQDSSGNFFVTTDGAGRVLQFNPSGVYVQDVPLAIDTQAYPAGIAIDQNDNLFVTEFGDNGASMEKFNPALTPIATFEAGPDQAGSYFEGATYCRTCGPNGVVYACDPSFQSGGYGIRVLDALTLQQIGTFGKEVGEGGELHYPESVVVNSQGEVLVSDWYGDGAIYAYAANGNFLYQVPTTTPIGGVGLALDPSGNLWVSDDVKDLNKFSPCRGTNTPTKTTSPTGTSTFTYSPTRTPRSTQTYSPTISPTSASSAGTSTPTPTPIDTWTYSPTITPTNTPVQATGTFTRTPPYTFTGTQTFSDSPTPSNTPSKTTTRTPSFTFSATFTQTVTVTPSATRTITSTSTITRTFSATRTITESFTASPSITSSRTPSPTTTPSSTPTNTPVHGAVIPAYPDTDGVVYAMALQGTTLYIGGTFSMVGASSRNNIAAIDATTGSVLSWDPNADSDVYSITTTASAIYVGGNFSNIGSAARDSIAALSPSTGLATSWASAAASDGDVYTIKVYGSVVYVGGAFSNIMSTAREKAAAITTAGVLTAWDPGNAGTITYVDDMAKTGTGSMMIGGLFSNIGGAARNNAAIVSLSTALATAWDANVDGEAMSLTCTSTSVYFGGNFSNIGGIGRTYAGGAKLFDGSVLAFDPAPDATLDSICLSGTTLYMAGAFANAGGASRIGFAAINTVDSTATAWIADAAGGSATGYRILSSPWAVFVGGDFTTINGVSKTGFAATAP